MGNIDWLGLGLEAELYLNEYRVSVLQDKSFRDKLYNNVNILNNTKL